MDTEDGWWCEECERTITAPEAVSDEHDAACSLRTDNVTA